MRQIKFRAWDKKKKKIVYDVAINESGFAEWDWNYEQYDRLSEIVMQFTGLKDKNGVDIYEGDIIKNKWGMTTQVTWEEDNLMYFPCSNEIRPNSNWDDREEFEVIGNIYENPNLLTL